MRVYALLFSVRTVLRAAIVPMAIVSLNGCLIKPRALDQQEVRARVVMDYQAILSGGEPISEPIDLLSRPPNSA